VETAGKGNLQNKTYKQDYNYKDRLESGKQAVGPISTQALVGWRLGECGNKFIGVCMEASSVTGAETADFFFYCNSLILTALMWLRIGCNGRLF
jgi:hypothetical protein